MTEKLTGCARYDVGGLEKPVRTPAGFLKADAYLTRAGIFEYRTASGGVRREFRPPEEVFKADSLSSFALAPVTDDHPPANLTAKNAREYQRGAVSENLRQDGDHLRGSMLITDDELIAKMERGEKGQVSCGYTCDVEMTPGEWKGQRYDAVQRNIRGNHAAIVKKGRAGASASVRMDEQDAAMISDHSGGDPAPTLERKVTVKTFRHDGITYEGSEQVIELVAKLAKERQDAIDGLAAVKTDAAKAVDAATAKADQAKVELDKAKADAARLPATVRAELAARMKLEDGARKILGKSAKFDGKDDRAVRAEVLKKLQPKLDLADKSEEYVAARFDAALEGAKNDTGAELERAREVVEGEKKDDEEVLDEDRLDVAAASERMKKANRELWKEPIGRQAK